MNNHLYEYLKTNRGVGHTRLLVDGAKNAQYPFLVIGADNGHANLLIRDIGNEFAIPTTINSERDFYGHNHPVLIDGHTFTKTCDLYISELRDMREAKETAEKKAAEIEIAINKISELPLWIRVIKPLYKRAIKRANG